MGRKLGGLFSTLIPISFVLSLLLWPSVWVYYEWQCEPWTITYYPNDGSQPRVVQGESCGWVQVWGNTGGDPPPSEYPPPGGGGGEEPPGGQTQNPNDVNNDGFIDCWRNVMIWLDGVVATEWGADRGFNADGTPKTHNAIDFVKPKTNISGLDIYSVSNGAVTWKSPNADSDGGWMVIVRAADNTEWTYCHLQSASTLAIGSTVTPGTTVIGQVGNTGTSTGTHLHLQVRPVGGALFDPRTKIGSDDC